MPEGPTGTTTTPLSTGVTPAAAGGVSPYTSSANVSEWAKPYVTDMLSTASTLADKPYTPYSGQLVAGKTDLQTSALSGIGALTAPTTQTWSALGDTDRQKFMNPYIQDVLNPQLEEAKRQSQIQNLQNRTQATKAGAYGGGRSALMESESQRNLQQNLAGITGKGYASAYDQAVAQFNKEKEQGLASLKSAQDLYTNQYGLGEKEREIQQQGLTSAYQQWQQGQQFPYEQLKFQQSMLSGLPLTTQSVTKPAATGLEALISTVRNVGALGGDVMSVLRKAGVARENETALDLIKRGWGNLFGLSSSGYQITDADRTNAGNVISNLLSSGQISTADAATALQSYGIGLDKFYDYVPASSWTAAADYGATGSNNLFYDDWWQDGGGYPTDANGELQFDT